MGRLVLILGGAVLCSRYRWAWCSALAGAAVLVAGALLGLD